MTRHDDETTGSMDADHHTAEAPTATDGGQTVAAESTGSESRHRVPDPGDDPELLHQTAPLLRPTLALAGVVLVVALAAIGLVYRNPDLVGGVEFAELVVNGVAILAALLLIRLGVTLLILLRTTYTIHEEGFKKEYELGYHRKSREIPVEQLRGREHERSRFETLLNCATIRLLTGGTDRSLGFLEFVHIPDPETVDEKITTVRRRHERRNDHSE